MDYAGQEPVVSMQPSANSNSHEPKRKVSIVETPDARNHAYDNGAFDGHKRKTSQVKKEDFPNLRLSDKVGGDILKPKHTLMGFSLNY